MAGLLFFGLPVGAQTVQHGTSGGLVLTAEARAVVVDVVVTGKNGKPVQGLREDDFKVEEDGRAQAVTSFEEHTGRAQAESTVPPLPPNVFTNIPRAPSTNAVTVLLLDSLNTPLESQSQVHRQMLKYLENPQPGRRLAIFSLGSRLRYVQGFTDDPAVLRKALADAKRGAGPRSSELLDSKTESMAEAQSTASLDGVAGLQDMLREQAIYRSEARLSMTLLAFQQLGKYLAGVPGRKNVVWFSSAFPLLLVTDSGLGDPLRYDSGDQVRKTDAALAAAQVAIYPVAAEGLINNSLYDSDTMLPVHSAYEAQQETNKSLQGDALRRNANHTAMDQIAGDTGGQAIYNSNGLSDALTRAVEHGSDYYTLYYTPANTVSDGRFRKISVKVTERSDKLAYRRGYYARKAEAAGAQVEPDPLAAQMGPGLPGSTQLSVALRVLPEPGKAGTPAHYAVDFVVAAKGLQLDAAADGSRHGEVEAMLLVYDQAGGVLNRLVQQLDLGMDAARYAQVQSNGVNFRLEIDAPKGATALRGGVYDPGSRLSGTLEVPLDRVVGATR